MLINKNKKISLILPAILAIVIFVFSATLSRASVLKQFNYQGRLTDTLDVAVTDGLYDFEFKIYTVAGGGSADWTETWSAATLWTETGATTISDGNGGNGCATGTKKIAYAADTNENSLKAGQQIWNTTLASPESTVIESVDTGGNVICAYPPAQTWNDNDDLTNRIYVKSGIFNVQLGSVTDLSVDFTGGAYYLGVKIGADSEMIPRKKIGSTPEAINSNNLSGDGIVDLDNTSTAQDAANINYNPASGTHDALDVTYGSGGGTGTALKVTQSGTGDILNLFDGADEVFTVLNGGNVGINTTAPGNKLTVSGGVGIGTTAPGSVFLSTAAPDGGMIIEGNVGIGTTNPGVKLDVEGSAFFGDTDEIQLLDEGGYGKLSLTSGVIASTSSLTVSSENGDSTYLSKYGNILISAQGRNTANKGNIYFAASPSAYDNSNIVVTFESSGNVGIGNSAPAGIFHVGIGNTTPLFVSTVGNVGIGTTNPGAALEVASGSLIVKNGQATGLTLSHYQITGGGSGVSLVKGSASVGINATDNITLHSHASKLMTFEVNQYNGAITDQAFTFKTSQDTTSWNTMLDRMTMLANGNVGIGTTAPAGIFHVGIGNTTPLFVSSTGNVGIGTTNPTEHLVIGSTSSSANEILKITGKADVAIQLIADTDNDTETHNPYIEFSQDGDLVNAVFGLTGSAGYDPKGNSYSHAIANALLIGGVTLDPAIQFGTHGDVRMTIDSDGNVGIGTTSPIDNFHVREGYSSEGLVTPETQSVALFQRNSTSGYNSYITIASGSQAYAGIHFGDYADVDAGRIIYDNSGNSLNFFTNATQQVTINSSGYVGIGTTNPARLLNVAGAMRLDSVSTPGSPALGD
ncbi:MAG: Procollagen, type XI, alpha, partial [Candidatus Moranbacteria bacterium GW2011_GWC2_40_12]